MNPMAQAAIFSIIRWALALGAGWLVNRGVWTQADASIYVSAAAMGLVSLGWSQWDKYKTRKTIVTALTMPVGATEDQVKQKIASGVTPTVTTPPNTVPGIPMALLFLLLFGAPCWAQSTAFDRVFPSPGLPTQAGRTTADVLSYVPVAVNLGLDAKTSCFDATDKKRGCGLLVTRVGVAWLSTYVIKTLVHRQRPCAPSCGIDSANSSFPSAHAAFTWSAFNGQKSIGITIPMGVAVDVGRYFAGKHWPTDVLAGDAIGAVISRIR